MARRRQQVGEDDPVSMVFGGSRMTEKKLAEILSSDRKLYYKSKELNDKLFLHYQGFLKLENLDGFTGLKTLYAENNAFEAIEGLDQCTQLRSLFLQENCIRSMDGLSKLRQLWSLNLSENFLHRLEGLAGLPLLNTLLVAKNRLGHGGLGDVLDLRHSSVSCLDLQNNCLSDPEILPEVLMKMPGLRVLYLKGNPVCKMIPNYRKVIIASIPQLKYLDDRPVFPEDRRYAEAFVRAGLEGEREERRVVKKEQDDMHRRNMEAFRNMVKDAKNEAAERKAMRLEDKYTDETDPVPNKANEYIRKWKEQNKDDLERDEPRENARRMLSQEKQRGLETVDRNQSQEAKKSTPEADEEDKEKDKDSGKEDKRQLVYEDIWGDGVFKPTPKGDHAAPEPKPARGTGTMPPPTTFAPPSRISKAKTPAGAAEPPRDSNRPTGGEVEGAGASAPRSGAPQSGPVALGPVAAAPASAGVNELEEMD